MSAVVIYDAYSYANSWKIRYIDKQVSARLLASSRGDRKTTIDTNHFFVSLEDNLLEPS